jgi:outer membrane receptor for ferrienterochelin and colicins
MSGESQTMQTITRFHGRAKVAATRAPATVASAILVVTMLASTTAAHAQSVDYQALEQLFGEPVTTSVTGKPQRAVDAPANIVIITQDDIRRSGATTIPDVLAFVTGVDVRTYGLGAQEVGIRGYNQAANPHLMVLIDGRQVYMVDYGRIVWENLPVQLTEIRQIEVIKGPNSALYGFNAVGGVINIITYDPLKEQINVASLGGGTQDFLTGSAVGTAKLGDVAGLRLSAGGFNAHDFAPGSLSRGDTLTRQAPFTGNFNADGRWRITPLVEAMLEGSFGTDRESQPTPQSVFDTEQLHQWSLRAGMNADSPIGFLDMVVYRNEVKLDGLAITAFRPQPFAAHEQQSVTVAQASDLFKIGTEHTVRAGLEFRRDADATANFNGQLADTIYAASLMWDWRITRTVTATNAVRFDHDEVSYSGTPLPIGGVTATALDAVRIDAPSLNSGVVWKATALDTFRVSLARGVQLPTLVEQGIQVPPGTAGPIGYFGRPNLLPSITWNAEADYDRSLPAIASVLRSGLFVQRTDNVISSIFGGPLTVVSRSVQYRSAANVGYSTAAGIEIGVKGHSLSGWRWNLSYALAETTNHTSLNAGGVLVSAQLYARSVPEHVVVAGIGYTHEKFEADLMAKFQSSFLDVRAPNTPGPLVLVSVDNYVTFTGRIAYRVVDNVTLALTAQQLNSASLITSGGAPQERRLIASVTARF